MWPWRKRHPNPLNPHQSRRALRLPFLLNLTMNTDLPDTDASAEDHRPADTAVSGEAAAAPKKRTRTRKRHQTSYRMTSQEAETEKKGWR